MKSIIFNYLVPILSTMLIGHMCNFPEKVLPMIPSIIGFFNKDNDNNKSPSKDYIPSAPKEPKNERIKENDRNKLSYKDYIPIIPKEPKKIWKLCELEHSLREIEKTYANDLEKKEKFTEEIIKQAKEIVGTGMMNAEILHKYYEFLENKNVNSFLSRVKGFFNFVNIIWTISIIGIIVSFRPAIEALVGIFIEMIFLFYDSFIKPILILLRPIIIKIIEISTEFFSILFYMIKIIPIIIELYVFGIIECLAYSFSIILIADGMRVNKEWGFYISMTGTGFILLLFIYSIELKEKDSYIDEVKMKDIILILLSTIVLFSLSVYFNSQLLSFLATILFYFFLIFYAEFSNLFFDNRFLDHFVLIKIVTSSFYLINFLFILKWSNIDNKIVELYKNPIQIFGTLSYYIGMLIISSKDYHIRGELSYVIRQVIYIFSLLIFMLFGNIFYFPFLINITYVFGILYLMQKVLEISSRVKNGTWLFVFIISLFLWQLSLYLHKHPEFIISLFSGN